MRGPNEQWSGEATRGGGFVVEDTRVDVLIGDEIQEDNASNKRKERPIWLMESTVITSDITQVIYLQYILLILKFLRTEY